MPNIIETVQGITGRGESYGTRIYSTIDSVLDDPFASSQLSAPTRAAVGSFLVAAFELGSMAATGNANMKQLMNMAMGVMMDLMGELATSAMGSAAGALPLFGALMEGLISFVDAGFAERKRKAAEASAQYLADCKSLLVSLEPIDTGVGGGYKPVDLFSQAYRSGFDDNGNPIFVNNDRIPMIGRMLEIITQTQWPGWLASKVGCNYKAMGIPEDVFHNFSLAPGVIYGSDSPIGEMCYGPPMWPIIDAYKRHWKALRLAILDQGIVARQMAGRPAGDGGTALWPLYMDLLFAATRIQQPPWGDETLMEGFTATAPLNPSIMRKLYATGFEYRPNIIGLRAQYGGKRAGARTQTADSFAGCENKTVKDKYQFWRAPQIVRAAWLSNDFCASTADLLVGQIEQMIDDWGNTVRPIYADDQALQARMLKETYGEVQSIVAERLVGLGFGGGQVKIGAIRQIEHLMKIGVVSEATASEGAAAISQGAKGGAPVILAGAALGLGILFMGG